MEVPKPEELTILVVLTDLRREGGSFVLAVPVSLKSQLHFVLAVADLALSPFFFLFSFFFFLGSIRLNHVNLCLCLDLKFFSFFWLGHELGPIL